MLQRLGASRARRNGFDTQDTFSFESCSSSTACDMEEVVSSESSRKMQDKEEATSDASWTAVTKGKGKEVWRLEPEGEAEKLEVTVLRNEAEGVSVNPEGLKASTSRHEPKSREVKRRSSENGKKGRSKCAW